VVDGVSQLSRVQGASFSIDFNRELLEYTNESLENTKFNTPVVNFNGDYLVTNGANEEKLGLVVNGVDSAISAINQIKNYYLVATHNNDEFLYYSGQKNLNIFAVGNCFLNSYNVNASVGGFTSASFTAEGLNVESYTGIPTGLPSPALNLTGGLYGNLFTIYSGNSFFNPSGDFPEQIAALGHKDIFMEIPINFGFSTEMSGSNSCALQDFSLSINFPKDDIYRMGSPVPERNLKMPVLMELNANAVLTKWQADTLLRSCGDEEKDIKIVIKKPCTEFLAIEYFLKGMKLESQEIGETMFDKTRVSFLWRGYIPYVNSTTNNLYITRAFAGNTSYAYILTHVRPIFGYDVDGNPFVSEEEFYERVEVS
jgi:hypothetical protein